MCYPASGAQYAPTDLLIALTTSARWEISITISRWPGVRGTEAHRSPCHGPKPTARSRRRRYVMRFHSVRTDVTGFTEDPETAPGRFTRSLAATTSCGSSLPFLAPSYEDLLPPRAK